MRYRNRVIDKIKNKKTKKVFKMESDLNYLNPKIE